MAKQIENVAFLGFYCCTLNRQIDLLLAQFMASINVRFIDQFLGVSGRKDD